MRALLSRRRALAGFTLIELLIVIVIIGILVAIGVPAYLKYTAAANDRDAQAALQVAYKAAVAGDTEVNNSRFPVAATIVNDITADEPAANAVSGSCTGTVALAPVKQVIVDTASTASQVVLCARSASGNVWKLSGPLTGTPTVADGSAVTLALSGFLVTDAVRAAGVQGDGLSADSSTGVWEPTTNKFAYGGFEVAGQEGFSSYGPGTVVARSAAWKQFGAWSLSATVTAGGFAGGKGTTNWVGSRTAAAPGQVWSSRITVNVPAGVQFQLGLEYYDGGGAYAGGDYHNYTGTGSAQTLTFTSTIPSGIAAVSSEGIRVTDGTACTVYIDGVQIEQKPLSTPYVDTNGAVASRTGGVVAMPATVVNSQTGWAAFRVRVNWDQAHLPGGGVNYWERLFSWGQESVPRTSLDVYYTESSNKWTIDAYDNNTFTGSIWSAVQSFSPGTELTVIGAWTPTTLSISVNGSAFATAGRSSAPALPGASFTVGVANTGGGSYWCDCDFRWAAFGTGTLSNTDAASINGFGSTDPKRASFPSAAQATMVWDGGTAGSLK